MGNRLYDANVKAFRALQPSHVDEKKGVTGKLDSNGVPFPNASIGLEDGLTWVRLEGGRHLVACVNLRVNPNTPGIPVLTAINQRTRLREIIDVDPEAFARFPAELVRRAAVPLPLIFDSDSLLMARVEPSENGGLWVYVRRFVHQDGTFVGAHYDFSATVAAMSADTQVMALVGVDTSTSTVSVTLGDEKSLAYVFTDADADAILVPSGILPLAALVLKDDQTLITDCYGAVPARYFDRREFLNLSAAAGGGINVTLRVVTAAGAVTVTTADYVVVVNKTVGAATVVNLPASPTAGDAYIVKDGKGDAATNNITLTPAAGNIDGAGTYVMNANYESISLVYNGTEWNIV